MGLFSMLCQVNCSLLKHKFSFSLLLSRRIIITNPQSKFHYVILFPLFPSLCPLHALCMLVVRVWPNQTQKTYKFSLATGKSPCNFIYIYGYFCFSLALISRLKKRSGRVCSTHSSTFTNMYTHIRAIIPHHLRCCGRPNRAICVLVTRLT